MSEWETARAVHWRHMASGITLEVITTFLGYTWRALDSFGGEIKVTDDYYLSSKKAAAAADKWWEGYSNDKEASSNSVHSVSVL